MKKQIAAGFFLFSFMLPLKAVASQKIEQIYTFGDSLSDVGNVFNATSQINNVGTPPAPYFNGRFSNGPLWVEYLATRLKIPQPAPYTTLPPGSFNSPNGINYAFGGSSSGLNNATFPTAPLPGTLAQVNLFTSSLTANQQSASPKALYIVWTGANDYLFGNVTNPQQPVDNISKAITALAAKGAKNIMVLNLADLGKLPGTRSSQFSPQLTTLTNAHNLALSRAIANLNRSLPSVNIIPVDVNTLLATAVKFPGVFGFTNVTEACFKNNTVCAKPNQYLFWDDFHPTTSAHRQIQLLALFVLKSRLRNSQAALPQDAFSVEVPLIAGIEK
jgi:phospholipase/lecithinase/hemolysin